MEQRIVKKFAWLPLRVKILNVEESESVLIWMSKYYEKQKFTLLPDYHYLRYPNGSANIVQWGWITVIKYLHSLD